MRPVWPRVLPFEFRSAPVSASGWAAALRCDAMRWECSSRTKCEYSRWRRIKRRQRKSACVCSLQCLSDTHSPSLVSSFPQSHCASVAALRPMPRSLWRLCSQKHAMPQEDRSADAAKKAAEKQRMKQAREHKAERSAACFGFGETVRKRPNAFPPVRIEYSRMSVAIRRSAIWTRSSPFGPKRGNRSVAAATRVASVALALGEHTAAPMRTSAETPSAARCAQKHATESIRVKWAWCRPAIGEELLCAVGAGWEM